VVIPTWRAVAFLAVEVDAEWSEPRTGLRRGRSHRLQRTMGDAEIEATTRVLRRVPAAVEAWSEGSVALDLRVVTTIREPVRRLSASGPGQYWLAPDDLPRRTLASLRPGTADAVFVLWPTDGTVPLCGWGCTIGPSPATNGAGYSSIISDGWRGYPERLHPEEGFVHEWLHQVESVLRRRGVGEDVMPNLHDVDRRTSCRAPELPPFGRTYPEHHEITDTWQPWYRDLMTGTVRGRDRGEPRCLGLHPAHWRGSLPDDHDGR